MGKEVELGKGVIFFKFFAENFFSKQPLIFFFNFFILHVKIAASLLTCRYDVIDDIIITMTIFFYLTTSIL